MAVQQFVSRTIGDASSRTVGIAVGLLGSFLVLASVGVWLLYDTNQGLIYELAYVLILLIVYTIVADRLLVR